MSNDYKQVEQTRLLYILVGTIAGGLLTDYWTASLCVSLIAYIIWMSIKLHQFNRWLETGDPNETPNSDGIWESLTNKVHSLKKTGNKRKDRMDKLLRRFQGIITGLPYATIVLNDKNEIDWANSNSKELLGINIKQDRGQRIENLIRLPKVHKILKKNITKEIEIVSPTDQNRELSLQLIPIQSDLKLIIARDISERVHIQQMRKNFIANASHELRTPLTVIAGYLEIIESHPELSDSLKQPVKTANEQALRMQSIIEDLLILSRLENSELNGESNIQLDMPKIIRSICDNEIELLSEQTQHTLEANIDANLTIRGSESEIISVCSNLIHNAIRHTPKGTAVNVTWRKEPTGEACLLVEDNGPGIPSEHLAHLTERFYRVDKGRSQNTGGTGLGLAIVQHIIQRHYGNLEIQSEIGKGSSFIVCFPEDRIAQQDTSDIEALPSLSL